MTDAFIDALIDTASADPDVIGLVLAGSSAEVSRRDRWSDHDFLLITSDGTPERYRTDLSWLPAPQDIGFWFRETAHGLKILYRTGLLLEFAVFDRAEFAGCALNHYRVVVDKEPDGGIAALAAQIKARSVQPATVDRLAALRLVLSLVYIGTGRARRGERLSANVFIRDHAVGHLLRLARDLLPADTTEQLDHLDPWRRFETAAPDLADDLDAALACPVDAAGLAVLTAADRFLRRTWAEYPADETALVVGLLTD